MKELDYFSTSEAAATLGVSRQRVLQFIEEGRLSARKVANIYLIPKGDLALVADRKHGRPPLAAKTRNKKAAVAKKVARKKGK